MKISIDDITNGTFGMRSAIVDVTELAESLEEHGLIHPITVRPQEDKYQLIAGHRRLAAAKQLGWKEIDANIKEYDDFTCMAIAIKENRDRQDVDPFDEAHAVAKATELFRKMRQEQGKKATAKEIYTALGYSERQYYRMFEFLDLEPTIRKVEKKIDEDESLPRVADFTQRELAEYAPFQTVYKDDPEKLEELITQTIDVKPSDRKRILEKLKVQPDRDVEEVKKEVTTISSPVQLKLYLYSNLAVGIDKACKERKATREDIVKTAVEDWLRRNKYV